MPPTSIRSPDIASGRACPLVSGLGAVPTRGARPPPQFADLRVRLGNVYCDMGVHHAAIVEFEHTKRIRPDYAPARIHLGVTLFSLGRAATALAEWQAVLATDPTNKSAQLYIRMVSDEHGPKPGSALPRSG